MKKNLLLIGLSRVIMNSLSKDDNIDVYILEEEELYYKNNLDSYKSSIIKKIIFTKYIDSTEYINDVNKLKNEITIHGVMPVRDYAVKAAADIAETLNLPGIGRENGKILTNKCLLRDACKKYNIPHPRFMKINTLKELEEFYQGKPVIFKPATLQASLGISKIDTREDIKQAWENTTSTLEIDSKTVARDIFRENIAEEFIGGFEVSVETFVKEGKIIFNNITKKLTFDNTFVEKGHTAPACLPEEIKRSIYEEKKHFIEKLHIKDGLLHSEWKVENDKPILVECAGRGPGDYIHEIIENSYNFNFFKEIINLLVGNDVHVNNHAKKVSMIRYFDPKPGKLKEIQGLDTLNIPEVIHWDISVKNGEYIPEVVSSWTRIGYFIISANNITELEKISSYILDNVKFIYE